MSLYRLNCGVTTTHLASCFEEVVIDYEAAVEADANHRPGVGPVTDRKRVQAIVDAALGTTEDQ